MLSVRSERLGFLSPISYVTCAHRMEFGFVCDLFAIIYFGKINTYSN